MAEMAESRSHDSLPMISSKCSYLNVYDQQMRFNIVYLLLLSSNDRAHFTIYMQTTRTPLTSNFRSCRDWRKKALMVVGIGIVGSLIGSSLKWKASSIAFGGVIGDIKWPAPGGLGSLLLLQLYAYETATTQAT